MLHNQTLLIFVLTFVIAISDAIEPNCGQKKKLPVGERQLLTNPGYPLRYSGKKNCLWHFTSDTRVRITCNSFNLPPSPNCDRDNLKIFWDAKSDPHKYCGNGQFSKDSNGKEIRVVLSTVPETPGGYFTCIVEAIDDGVCECGWKKPESRSPTVGLLQSNSGVMLQQRRLWVHLMEFILRFSLITHDRVVLVKIVGGDETGINEFPMMAGIIDVLKQHVHCGATIISPTHVLTAAHCLKGLNINQLGVLVGEHDITTGKETNATKLFRLFRLDVHPSYDPNKQDFDMAMITVDGLIVFSNEVGPACLPFQHYLDSFGGSFVHMLGWGTDEYAGLQSVKLQKVRVSVTNFLTCKDAFPGLTYRQICTSADGMDACQYDSGGPVLWQNPTTRRLVLVGIISYGSGCASSVPAVNTRVGSFIDWIIQVTGVQFCQAE